MGFGVTIIDGHATITKDQKTWKEFDMPEWRDMMVESLNGADYVE